MPKLKKRQEADITIQDKQDMVEAYNKGRTIDAISLDYGITAYEVEQIVTNHGPVQEQKGK